MKPTMIKTKTTKRVEEMEHDEVGYINIGGLDHRLHCWDGLLIVTEFKPLDEYWCDLHRDIDPRCKVTVYEQREMTVKDLQVGDCFVTTDCLKDDAFVVCTYGGDTGYVKGIRVSEDGARPVSMAFRGDPVTLVDVEFEAEPVDEERTVRLVDACAEFTLGGQTGMTAVIYDGFTEVRWASRDNQYHLLPNDTPVTVREFAAYDSWEDVSVGDVVISNTFGAGVVIEVGSQLTRVLSGGGTVYGSELMHQSIKRARLTSVTWTPREEVTR